MDMKSSSTPRVTRVAICLALLFGALVFPAHDAIAQRATPMTQQKYHTHYAPAANLIAQKETPHRPASVPK
jgi:hypothetical protein